MNMNSWKVYTSLAVIVVVSLTAAAIPRLGELTRAVAALPAAVAVMAAVFQLLRDQMAYDRAAALQASQNTFAVGATSHMAIVTFDKHVLFSEEYVSETFRALRTLFRDGPTEKALGHASTLYHIREKWAVWLTPTIDTRLEVFEAALRKIGADTHFVNVDLANPDRSKVINETMDLFRAVMGKHISNDAPVSGEQAIANVVEEIRRILGISELTRLRQALVSVALQSEPANQRLQPTAAGAITSRRG